MSSVSRIAPLALLLLFAYSSFVFCEDQASEITDCGSPVIKPLKIVQHGDAYPGGSLNSTITLQAAKPTKGGRYKTTVYRYFWRRYIPFGKDSGSLCKLIQRPEGCELKKGEVVSYINISPVPRLAPRGKYQLRMQITGSDGEKWACYSVSAEVVSKPSEAYMPQ